VVKLKQRDEDEAHGMIQEVDFSGAVNDLCDIVIIIVSDRSPFCAAGG